MIDTLTDAVTEYGLIVFGVVDVTQADRDQIGCGNAITAAALIGNAGPAMWDVFDAARAADPALAAAAHPMDTWTRRVVESVVASVFRGTGSETREVVFPSDGPPYVPFQRWAVRTGRFFPSPIGPLVHRTYGPWAGFRAAVLLQDGDGASDATSDPVSPCDTCADTPCLTTCPVSAFDGAGYDVPACVDHIETPAGADCITQGCRARRACPYGHDYHQSAGQAGFHMGKFITARRAAMAERASESTL